MNTAKNIVINWHITEACNHHCKFCFAKWNKPIEIWSSPQKVKKVISNISHHFHSHGFVDIRLNVVGGEPTMFPERLRNVLEIAYDHNINISLITNGSHLENIHPFAQLISQVGISIDSLDHITNMKIGRNCGKCTISFSDLHKKIEGIRKVKPDIKIKLNTVVNKFNFDEILVNDFAKLHINKWKILRQMPFNGNKGVSNNQFYTFLRSNYNEELMKKNAPQPREDSLTSSSKQIIYIEDNEAMTESYLMIAPDGRLFQNGGEEYYYSHPLTEVPLAEALKNIKFNNSKFEERYKSYYTLQVKHKMENFFTSRAYIWNPMAAFTSMDKPLSISK